MSSQEQKFAICFASFVLNNLRRSSIQTWYWKWRGALSTRQRLRKRYVWIVSTSGFHATVAIIILQHVKSRLNIVVKHHLLSRDSCDVRICCGVPPSSKLGDSHSKHLDDVASVSVPEKNTITNCPCLLEWNSKIGRLGLIRRVVWSPSYFSLILLTLFMICSYA